MTRDEAILDFLRGLRVCLNVSTLYSKEHPSFLKTAEDFREKAVELLKFETFIKLDITVSSLLIGEKDYTKEAMCQDMVGFLHNRKIKNIEIKPGLIVEEAAAFMSLMAMRPSEVAKAGGLGKIITGEKLTNIVIDELEYSQLLKGGDEEVEDVWKFLLSDAAQQQNSSKYDLLASNYKKIIDRFKTKEFLEDEELQKNMDKFMQYLKQTKNVKYSDFSKGMLKAILEDKQIAQYDSVDKLKEFLRNFNPDDLANALVDQISNDSTFDSLNLKLFFRLTDEKGHRETASLVKEKLENTPSRIEGFQTRMKLKDLLSMSDNPYVSEIYRNTLSRLLEDVSFEGKFHFDVKQLTLNYRFILLNLLAEEQDYRRLLPVVERVTADWEAAAQEVNWEYMRGLLDTLTRRKKKASYLGEVFLELENKIFAFVEEKGLSQGNDLEISRLVDSMEGSLQDKEYYLAKIFKERRVSSGTLKILFKFFPEAVDIFIERLKPVHGEAEFMERIIHCLKLAGEPAAARIYKGIYAMSNELVKAYVLQAMQERPRLDERFLLAVLRTASSGLRKEAFLALQRDEKLKKKALDTLLFIFNLIGERGGYILENIAMLDELDFREAKPYLLVLAKRPFFWNKAIRDKSQEVLDKWH